MRGLAGFGRSQLRKNGSARGDGRVHPFAGDTVYLLPTPKHVHVFDADSGARLLEAPVVS